MTKSAKQKVNIFVVVIDLSVVFGEVGKATQLLVRS